MSRDGHPDSATQSVRLRPSGEATANDSTATWLAGLVFVGVVVVICIVGFVIMTQTASEPEPGHMQFIQVP